MDTEQADGQVAVAQAEFADVFGTRSKRDGQALTTRKEQREEDPIGAREVGRRGRGWDGRADATAAPGHGSTVVEARA